MANAQTTKLKILDAAEELFAQSGFSETSLRQITNKAEVNLASVNYHFGSKKEGRTKGRKKKEKKRDLL